MISRKRADIGTWLVISVVAGVGVVGVAGCDQDPDDPAAIRWGQASYTGTVNQVSKGELIVEGVGSGDFLVLYSNNGVSVVFEGESATNHDFLDNGFMGERPTSGTRTIEFHCLRAGTHELRAVLEQDTEVGGNKAEATTIAQIVCGEDHGAGGGGAGGSGGSGGSGAGGEGGSPGNDCASGQATDGPVTVNGTTVDVTVGPNDCPVKACVVGVVNNHNGFLTMLQADNMGPVTFLNDDFPFTASVIEGPNMLSLDVEISDCSMSRTVQKQLEFVDEGNNFTTYGPFPITVNVTVE